MTEKPLTLPPSPNYFPMQNGLYEVAPGLKVFGTDFGNGRQDQCVFQIDQTYQKYRDNKVACRAERLNKYYVQQDFSDRTLAEIAHFLIHRLTQEHPQFFQFNAEKRHLDCLLSGDQLFFDSNFKLIQSAEQERAGNTPKPAYADAFDALCAQVQEDVAVWQCTRGADKKMEREWLSALHLCSPNHWAAEDKVGRSFTEVHKPVAGIEKINRAAMSIVDAMITRGPYVRFAWGVATDATLNHHPEPTPGISLAEWQGRKFDPKNPKLFLRIERQTLTPFPEVNASLFTIRTYFEDCAVMKQHPEKREKIKAALLSMTPESLRYKGLEHSLSDVLDWLQR